MMRNLKLTIEYDGTNFKGFQKQEGKRTIQGELEEILSGILKEEVNITGSGRTDTGVHALNQVANFKTEKTIKCDELRRAINSVISKDISVLNVEEVEEKFNARRSAIGKHYRYVINNSDIHSALNYNREYTFKYFLDVSAMELAAKDLIGKHDFKAFMKVGSSIKDTKKEIYDVSVNRVGNRVIIDIIGSGFLYNMVRIIVGTLLDIGTGKLDICTVKNMIETGDRTSGGQTVPAQGLFMVTPIYK